MNITTFFPFRQLLQFRTHSFQSLCVTRLQHCLLASRPRQSRLIVLGQVQVCQAAGPTMDVTPTTSAPVYSIATVTSTLLVCLKVVASLTATARATHSPALRTGISAIAGTGCSPPAPNKTIAIVTTHARDPKALAMLAEHPAFYPFSPMEAMGAQTSP